MTELRTIIEGLLSLMRSAGQHEDAARFEIEFEERGWDVTLQDQLRVLQSMMGAVELAPVPQAKAPDRPQQPDSEHRIPASPPPRARPEPTLPAPPKRFALMERLAPWVGKLPGRWNLVAAVEALMTSTSVSSLASALETIFVEHLGFDRVAMDETARLSSQTTLTKVVAVANFEDFHIVAVETRYAGYHTSSFGPVFQLHPRSLIVALERGSRIRVVARKSSSNISATVQRIVRGCGQFSFPDDDIFVWAYRFASLEPKKSDDARSLNERARTSVSGDASALCATWQSQSFTPADLPGQPWETTCDMELREFLQPEAPSRLFLGLEVELRTAFPWESKCGRVAVRYLNYRVLDVERDADAAEAKRTTLSATLEIDLEHHLQSDDGAATSNRFTLRAAIAVPDERGVFVLYGAKLVFTPRLLGNVVGGHDASLFSTNDGVEDDDDDDELDVDVDDDDDDAESTADSDSRNPDSVSVVNQDDLGEHPQGSMHAYGGDGLVPLLRWVVGSKLRFFGVGFNKTTSERLSSPGHVLAWLGRYERGDGRIHLTSASVLRQHLEPFNSALPIRTLVCATDVTAPGWACPELARELPSGRAYPIAGARLGPASRLATLVLDEYGDLQLTVNAQASPNPRSTSDATNIPAALWIAGALRRFANLRAGSVPRALDLAIHGFGWEGEVFVGDGEPAELWFEPSRFQAPRRSVRWTFDIPTPPRQQPPTVRVHVHQVLRSGDPVAEFSGPWTDAEHRIHHVTRIAQELTSGEVGGAAGPASRAFILRCPPSIAGRIDDVQLTEFRSPRGLVTGYRVTLVTSRPTQVKEAVLEDGRVLPVTPHAPEDFPWHKETGATASVFLRGEDSDDSEIVPETEWLSGATGEPMRGSTDRRYVVFLPGRKSAAPDPCLSFRVIDGWGNPRAADDPHITQQHLELLAGTEPEQAATIHALMRTVHGGHVPSATTLFELARATHVAAPPFIPSDWILDVREARGPYDPVRSSLRRQSSVPYASERGPWSWRCTCGALSGMNYVQVRCAKCDTETQRLWVGLPEHVIRLPCPILHPWRKSITGGLLGVTERELDEVIGRDDCTPLHRLTEVALAHPTRSIDRRITLETDLETRATLWQQRDALIAGSRRITLEDLWLSELRIVSPRLLCDGYRTGSTALLNSPLTCHYRKIQSLAKMDVVENPILRRALWIELQRTTDILFGSPASEHPERGTLAELWHRVWPTTAPQTVRLAVPGLFEHCSAHDLRDSTASELLGSKASLSGSHETWPRGILTADGVEPLISEPTRLATENALPEAERRAWSRCIDRHFRDMALACLGTARDHAVVAALRSLPGADTFADTQDLGRLVLRELLHRLAAPGAQPSAFLRLMTGQRPLVLPSDHAEAHLALEKRLALSIPGDEVGARLVRTALAWILGGFWSGAPSAEIPHGWRWAPSGNPPDGLRRAVPLFGSRAWRCFPGYCVLKNPCQAATRGWTDGWLRDYDLWFGLDAEELPPRELLSATPEASKPPALPDPLETPLADSEEIRILEESLEHWLLQHRRAPQHVDP